MEAEPQNSEKNASMNYWMMLEFTIKNKATKYCFQNPYHNLIDFVATSYCSENLTNIYCYVNKYL